jgi:hypothetical protein
MVRKILRNESLINIFLINTFTEVFTVVGKKL